MTAVGRFVARARESLFFLPTVLVLLCGGAAWLALLLDGSSETVGQIPVILSVTVDGGRAIATTVAGATITVAAIVFSITALTSQMASSQYSPRSVGGFFEDPLQQAIIGLVVGTFTYSLLILAGIGSVLGEAGEVVPSLAVTLDIVLGVASAIAIVGYLDHSLRRMQIDSVVFRIARATVEAVRAEHEHDDGPDELSSQGQPEGAPQVVEAARSGWVVGINPERLLESLPAASTARVDVRIGEPVSEGDQIITIWPSPQDEHSAQAARRAIGVATQRSISGDPSFGIRQLVDIALRALSPGVNDPTTAVDVIHHLKVPVREILLLPPPVRVFNGGDGRQVFLTATPSRSDYVREAFSEVRLAARGQLYVLRALIEVLEDLATEMRAKDLEGRLGAVERELQLTVETARNSGFPESDLELLLATRRLKDESE